MSKLTIAGIALALLLGTLEAIWRVAVDQQATNGTGLYPKGHPTP